MKISTKDLLIAGGIIFLLGLAMGSWLGEHTCKVCYEDLNVCKKVVYNSLDLTKQCLYRYAKDYLNFSESGLDTIFSQINLTFIKPQ